MRHPRCRWCGYALRKGRKDRDDCWKGQWVALIRGVEGGASHSLWEIRKFRTGVDVESDWCGPHGKASTSNDYTWTSEHEPEEALRTYVKEVTVGR